MPPDMSMNHATSQGEGGHTIMGASAEGAGSYSGSNVSTSFPSGAPGSQTPTPDGKGFVSVGGGASRYPGDKSNPSGRFAEGMSNDGGDLIRMAGKKRPGDDSSFLHNDTTRRTLANVGTDLQGAREESNAQFQANQSSGDHDDSTGDPSFNPIAKTVLVK